MESSIKKFHSFYLLSEKRLYAFTEDDEFAKLFENQRNMKQFSHSKVKMDKIEWSAFLYQNRNIRLVRLPLYDGINTFEIIGTIEEDNILSDASEHIDFSFAYLKSGLVGPIPLKDKYLNLISTLTDVVKTEKASDGNFFSSDTKILEVNTFKLFYYLFRKTFYDIDDSDDDKYFS